MTFIVIVFTLVVLFLKLVDAYTTHKIITRGGYEQNKVVRWLMDHLGMDMVLVLDVLLVTIASYWLGSNQINITDQLQFPGVCIVLVFIIYYTWVAYHNITELEK